MIRRVYRAPALHFLVLGLLAFLLLREPLAGPQVLVVDQQAVQQALRDWQTLQQAPVTDEQRLRLKQQLARSAILVDRAIAAGLDRSAAVEQRLLQLAHFLELVEPGTDDTSAIEAARALNLHRTDTVIQRYLETAAEFLLANEMESVAVGPEEVDAFYREHAEQFRTPRRLRLSHAFIAGDTPAGQDRAARLAQNLAGKKPDEGINLGDPFYGGHVIDFKSRRQLANQFGEAFAEAVWELPVQRWSQPIQSAYGWHLVYVEEEMPASLQPLTAVRGDIVTRITRQRQQQWIEQRVAELRRDYHIVGLDGLEG